MTNKLIIENSALYFNLERASLIYRDLLNVVAFMVTNNMVDLPQYKYYHGKLQDAIQQLDIERKNFSKIIKKLYGINVDNWYLEFSNGILEYQIKKED